MNYARALAERRRAMQACQAARNGLDTATTDALRAYQARPLPVLTVAAAAGFALAQLGVDRGALRSVMRVASGPGWKLVQRLFDPAG